MGRLIDTVPTVFDTVGHPNRPIFDTDWSKKPQKWARLDMCWIHNGNRLCQNPVGLHPFLFIYYGETKWRPHTFFDTFGHPNEPIFDLDWSKTSRSTSANFRDKVYITIWLCQNPVELNVFLCIYHRETNWYCCSCFWYSWPPQPTNIWHRLFQDTTKMSMSRHVLDP